jgi:hypothetical protein
MLLTFWSITLFSSLMAASPGVDGPVRSALPARPPALPTVVVEPADALPVVLGGAPEELAVPSVLVPGDVGIFAELPTPLGSFAELLRPPVLAGPFGIPLIAVVPAPADPALGVPAVEPEPTDGPLAAPPPVDPPPVPWACALSGESRRAVRRNLAGIEMDIGVLRWSQGQRRRDISCSRPDGQGLSATSSAVTSVERQI